MSVIEFKKQDVMKLLAVLGDNDKITLVGDHGVYLMSFGEPHKVLPEDGPRTLAYALGCNPDIDPDFYENKRSLFGGDDGADDLCTALELKKLMWPAKSYFIIRLTDKFLDITYQ